MTFSVHPAGHINFNDEVSAALRLADGMLLVVDAAEGVMLVTEKAVKQAIMEGLPICLLISKVHQPILLLNANVLRQSKWSARSGNVRLSMCKDALINV